MRLSGCNAHPFTRSMWCVGRRQTHPSPTVAVGLWFVVKWHPFKVKTCSSAPLWVSVAWGCAESQSFPSIWQCGRLWNVGMTEKCLKVHWGDRLLCNNWKWEQKEGKKTDTPSCGLRSHATLAQRINQHASDESGKNAQRQISPPVSIFGRKKKKTEWLLWKTAAGKQIKLHYLSSCWDARCFQKCAFYLGAWQSRIVFWMPKQILSSRANRRGFYCVRVRERSQAWFESRPGIKRSTPLVLTTCRYRKQKIIFKEAVIKLRAAVWWLQESNRMPPCLSACQCACT